MLGGASAAAQTLTDDTNDQTLPIVSTLIPTTDRDTENVRLRHTQRVEQVGGLPGQTIRPQGHEPRW